MLTLAPRGCRARKVDVRLPGKGNSNFHGARPVHLIITMIKWIRTSRLSIKNSLSVEIERCRQAGAMRLAAGRGRCERRMGFSEPA